MTIQDALHEGHHELCRNHAKSSSQGQCPRSETIQSEVQWMWRRVLKCTNRCYNLTLVTQDVSWHFSKISSCEWRDKWEANVFKVDVDRNRKTTKRPQSGLSGNTVPSPKLSSERLSEEWAYQMTQISSSYLDRIFNNLVITRLIRRSQWWLKLPRYQYIPATYPVTIEEISSLPLLPCSTCLDRLCQKSHSRSILALWSVLPWKQSGWWWLANGGQWRVS